jgi:putative tryptophan/tyrosine transport system substrate-binding protein
MNRRDLMTLIGGAAAWPVAARAQQARLPVIGILNSNSSRDAPVLAERMRAFRQGLGESGYIEGQNVVTEYRWAENEYDRLAPLAADLVRSQVAVILALGGVASALAAKAATATIPIVFNTGGDPVKLGLVSSLSRPGGNLTGMTSLGNALAAKQLQILHELLPKADVIAFLANPSNPNAQADTKDVQRAADALGQEVHVLSADSPRGIDAAFATLVQQRAGALLVARDPFFNVSLNQLATLALRYAVPTMFSVREFATAGGLMSYGPSLLDAWHPIGVYTGRILRGEKPGDLPVVQASKFEFVINLKSATTLGLTIPPSLLAVADEVIE